LLSGAYVALAAQCGLITWDFSTREWRHRWRLLGMLCIVAYVVVDMISNRFPIEVFIEYLTFSHHNSYNRILIWEYGTAEVWRHPVFGIGMTEWERPYWMSGSMDNFWLVAAIRYGLPAFVFFAGATLLICLQLGRLQQIKPEIKQCRTGLLVSIGGLVIAGCTVHFWNATYCLFMFLLGSGMWMLDQDNSGQPRPQVKKGQRITPRTSQ